MNIIRVSTLATVTATILVATLGLPGGEASAQTGPAQTASVAKPEIIAVKFHADWCGSCKAMGPIFDDLANKFDGEPVLFVELDLTNRTTLLQAEFMAKALGIEDLWISNGHKTGTVKLVDYDTRDVVATLNRRHDVKAMGKELSSAIENAR